MNVAIETALFQAIGNNIKKCRKNAELNQAHLASQIGLSRTSLVNIEQGRQHPSLFLIWRIAEALDIEASDLLPTRSEVVVVMNGVQPSYISGDIKHEESYDRIQGFLQTVKTLPHESQKTESNRAISERSVDRE